MEIDRLQYTYEGPKGRLRTHTTIKLMTTPAGRFYIKVWYHTFLDDNVGYQTLESQTLIGDIIDLIRKQGAPIEEKRVGPFRYGRTVIRNKVQWKDVTVIIKQGPANYKFSVPPTKNETQVRELFELIRNNFSEWERP